MARTGAGAELGTAALSHKSGATRLTIASTSGAANGASGRDASFRCRRAHVVQRRDVVTSQPGDEHPGVAQESGLHRLQKPFTCTVCTGDVQAGVAHDGVRAGSPNDTSVACREMPMSWYSLDTSASSAASTTSVADGGTPPLAPSAKGFNGSALLCRRQRYEP